MKIFKSEPVIEDRDVKEMIDEQRHKESIGVWRRGWCISEATCLDDCNKDNVIQIAEKIYKYVYRVDEE